MSYICIIINALLELKVWLLLGHEGGEQGCDKGEEGGKYARSGWGRRLSCGLTLSLWLGGSIRCVLTHILREGKGATCSCITLTQRAATTGVHNMYMYMLHHQV